MLDAKATIAAIATAAGRGGIGVIRVSGTQLTDFAVRLTGKKPKPRQVAMAQFRDAEEQVIDQGILLYFSAPHSFTGEDVLELQAHGGPVVMQLLLQRCLELGARLAEPGEFTKRAFLNDKLDLAQAEAVADLIDAASIQAARSAVRSLSGEFSRQVMSISDQLIDMRMLIEATLDFPDEEIDAADLLLQANLSERLAQLQTTLKQLQKNAYQGSLLRRGLHVVLAGAPNVGKSSLLNALAGEERAIVTPVAGTTRDALRETILIEGIPLNIIDTAGLRETTDAVEQIGITRSWQEINRADVVLHLVDASSTSVDDDLLVSLPAELTRITIHNKCDLTNSPALRWEEAEHIHLQISAMQQTGIDLVRQELLRIAGFEDRGEDLILARERHLQALTLCLEHLSQAESTTTLEFKAEELRCAQLALASITGEFTSDDLLGVIFSRFCIGK